MVKDWHAIYCIELISSQILRVHQIHDFFITHQIEIYLWYIERTLRPVNETTPPIANIIVCLLTKDQATLLRRITTAPRHLCETPADARGYCKPVFAFDELIDLLIREHIQMMNDAFVNGNSTDLGNGR
jgi:hypothetical protein